MSKVIKDNKVSWLESWDQELLDVSGEIFGVDRAVENGGR